MTGILGLCIMAIALFAAEYMGLFEDIARKFGKEEERSGKK